jgi:two-component system chemotaxis response regulator CheY
MPRILIIDDDESIRYILRETLQRAGYEVDEAHNGREGLQRYRVTPAHLVITDIVMPEKNGLETIQELRHDFPCVKIIVMSGSREQCDMMQQLGVQSTLRKPFDLRELLAVVQTVVSTRSDTATV